MYYTHNIYIYGCDFMISQAELAATIEAKRCLEAHAERRRGLWKALPGQVGLWARGFDVQATSLIASCCIEKGKQGMKRLCSHEGKPVSLCDMLIDRMSEAERSSLHSSLYEAEQPGTTRRPELWPERAVSRSERGGALAPDHRLYFCGHCGHDDVCSWAKLTLIILYNII